MHTNIIDEEDQKILLELLRPYLRAGTEANKALGYEVRPYDLVRVRRLIKEMSK